MSTSAETRIAMTELSWFLRRALPADAVFSGVNAVSLISGAAPFAQLFELPETLLRETRPVP